MAPGVRLSMDSSLMNVSGIWGGNSVLLVCLVLCTAWGYDRGIISAFLSRGAEAGGQIQGRILQE